MWLSEIGQTEKDKRWIVHLDVEIKKYNKLMNIAKKEVISQM